MKKFNKFLDEAGRCWPGHKPVPGKKPYSPGSCRKEEVELDEAKKMEYDQKKVNHLKYIVDILEKEKKEFSRLKGSEEVIGIINKAINLFAKEYTKHLNALSDGRGQDTNFRFNEEVEQIDEISKETAGKYLTAPQGKGANKYKVSSDKSVYPNIETMSKHSANVRRALKRSEGSSLYKKPDYYKEDVEELDEKMISVRNAIGKTLKVSSQFKDIYKKHGYKPVPGTRLEDYEADDGPLTEDQLEQIEEVAAWQRKEGKSEAGGLNRKGIESYRRENPGSKLSIAVTTKPSKLKPGSKAANRRKSFCARMGGMKRRLTSAKTARDPDSRINKALRKWNC